MAGTPTPPPGYKLDAPSPPPGYKLDQDTSGSIFDTGGQKLKSIGKSIGKFAAGAAPVVAATMVPGYGEASVATKIGLQALGGAVSPYTEYAASKLMGENPQLPGVRQAAVSAGFAVAGGLVGEAIFPAGRAAAVSQEIRALPEEAQTAANVKQAMRNRDFWKAHGLNDQQIDQVLQSPKTQAEIEAANAAGRAAGVQYKGAFQAVKDNTANQFHVRYDAILGPHANVRIDATPIGKEFEALAQGTGQHELTPTFRGFLQRKGLELTKAGESGGPSVGGVPWKQLPENLKAQIRAQGVKQGVTAPSGELSPQDIRDLRTELRENLPSSATNLDKQAAQQLGDKLTQLEQDTLKANGATTEQLASLKAVDQEYGDFQQSIRALDPRSERFGPDVANLLWSNAAKNPSDALNFIAMAQAADAAKPGVMADLRKSFLDKAMAETRTAAQGRPVEEMRALQKMQTQWGGDKQTKAVLTAMFPDSPLQDPTTMARVIGRLSNPDQSAADSAKSVLADLGKAVVTPKWMVRLGLMYYMIQQWGGHGGLFSNIGKPEVLAPAMAELWLSGKTAEAVFGWGDRQIQRRYVDFLLNPNATTMRNFGALLGAGAAAGESMPTPQKVAAER